MTNPASPSRPLFLWLLTLAALIFYCLPWVITTAASLTMGAYDLAEWSSLHPASRGASIPLLPALLLRLPLVCLALAAAFAARRGASWWLYTLFVGLMSAALLPPLEFFTQAGSDPNYRQQFGLALFALIGGTAGLTGRLSSWNSSIIPALALAGVAASAAGLWQAEALLRDFQLPAQLGLGVFGLAACLLGLAAVAKQTG